MLSYFIYNGKSSKDFGIIIEDYPNWPKPAKKINKITIPGRNGDLLIHDGSYKNVILEYKIAFHGGPQKASEIADWLPGADGYQRLEDTYHPGKFRLAAFEGPMGIVSYNNEFGKVTLKFNCRPETFLEAGTNPIRLDCSAGRVETTLNNPGMTALPKISLRCSGPVGVGIGPYELDIWLESGALTDVFIDCQSQAVSGSTGSLNSVSELKTEFPRLDPGASTVIITPFGTSSVESCEIIPGWWSL